MKEVFRVYVDVNIFQTFLPVNECFWATNDSVMNCVPKMRNWRTPEVYIFNPKRVCGDFFHFLPDALVVGASGLEKIRDILEMAGELLPINCDGVEYSLLNVLECVNCLDVKKSEWLISKSTGEPFRLKKYRFHQNRFSESTLFKIPETAKGEILCLSGVKDPEDEFKAQVESLGLKGLIFERVWSEEDEN
jgi:hypothetical protein